VKVTKITVQWAFQWMHSWIQTAGGILCAFAVDKLSKKTVNVSS